MLTFELSTAVLHKRIAKAYCCCFCEGLGKYIVCFEPIERFKFTVEPQDLVYDPELKMQNKSQNQPIRRWLCTIRETFEVIEELQKVGFRLGADNPESYVYAKSLSEETGSNDLVLKILTINVTQFPNYAPLTQKEVIDKDKCVNRAQYLMFLEHCGAGNLQEYKSFKYLVESGASLEVFLNHPFLLGTPEQRVTSITSINEDLFDLKGIRRDNLDKFLEEEFQNEKWKDILAAHRSKFRTFVTSGYGDPFHQLAIFLRNYVEHLRDSHSQNHVDYEKVEELIFGLFSRMIGWLYSCAYTFRKRSR